MYCRKSIYVYNLVACLSFFHKLKASNYCYHNVSQISTRFFAEEVTDLVIPGLVTLYPIDLSQLIDWDCKLDQLIRI